MFWTPDHLLGASFETFIGLSILSITSFANHTVSRMVGLRAQARRQSVYAILPPYFPLLNLILQFILLRTLGAVSLCGKVAS